jgi:hypothetical protein
LQLIPIRSSNLVAIGYDPSSRTLAVQFGKGGTYQYFDVDPSLYQALWDAQPHPWTAHGREVKAHRYAHIG